MQEPARYGYPGSRGGAGGESLVRYLGVLRERWWLIALCTAAVLAAAAVYVKLAPRTYQAQAELLVQPSSPSDPVLSTLPVLHQSGDPTQDVLSAASLITTPTVAHAVVSALHLPISAAAALGDVSATPIGQTDLVAVQATSGSPRLSQQLANGFARQAIAVSTAQMHAAIAAELPGLEAKVAAIPPAQRYGPGSLGAEVDELQVLQHQSNPTMSIAARASLPTAPSSPKTKLALLGGLLAGLLLGIGAAFAANALDPRLRRAEQVRERLGLPVLARIGRERRRRPAPLLPHDLSPASQEGHRTLRTTLATRGPWRERARAYAARVDAPVGAPTRERRGSQVYLVTGAGPGEGKSTTAISLAFALAETGAGVLLLEADLRRPTFFSVFGLYDFRGVEDVLSGELEVTAAAASVLVDGVALQVLASHPSVSEFAARLSFEQVRRLVSEAKAAADFVVIDSPPLTAVIDALPFAQLADEIVLVGRIGRTRLKRLEELDELLRQNGTPPSGVVVIGEGVSGSYYGGYAVSPQGGVVVSPPQPRIKLGRPADSSSVSSSPMASNGGNPRPAHQKRRRGRGSQGVPRSQGT